MRKDKTTAPAKADTSEEHHLVAELREATVRIGEGRTADLGQYGCENLAVAQQGEESIVRLPVLRHVDGKVLAQILHKAGGRGQGFSHDHRQYRHDVGLGKVDQMGQDRLDARPAILSTHNMRFIGRKAQSFKQMGTAGAAGREAPVDVFLALTLRNVMGSLTDLEQLGRALNQQPVSAHPCQLMNCPRGAQLQEGIAETIRVLEETKGAFKSKALGDLRHKLELLLTHV